MKLSALLILSALLLPSVAQAQAIPEGGIRITGEITGAHARSDSFDISYAFGSIDLFTPRDQGLRFSLGIDAVRYVSGVTSGRAALYPAASYGFGNGGRLSFGIPRSASDRDGRLLPDNTFAYSRQLDITPLSILFRQSITAAVYLNSSTDIYGLRYDGDAGALSYAVSYHHLVPDSGDRENAYALALSRSVTGPGSLPEARVYLAIEHLDLDSSNRVTSYMIGAEASGERLAGGLNYTKAKITGLVVPEISTIETWADYAFSDRFSTRLSLLRISPPINDTYYGIGLKYTPRENISLHASMLGSDSSANTQWELGLTWEF